MEKCRQQEPATSLLPFEVMGLYLDLHFANVEPGLFQARLYGRCQLLQLRRPPENVLQT